MSDDLVTRAREELPAALEVSQRAEEWVERYGAVLADEVVRLQVALRLMSHWDECWTDDEGKRLPGWDTDEEPPECFCPKQRAPGTYTDHHMTAPRPLSAPTDKGPR